MELDCRTALVLRHPDGKQVLLLKRSASKKLLPSLITGIGGKVELVAGEGADIEKSMLREFFEETKINDHSIEKIKLRLVTLSRKPNIQFVIFWFTGWLKEVPKDLSCNEGDLSFYRIDSLPLQEFTNVASEAIPFVLSHDDDEIHNAVLIDDGKSMLVN